LPHFGGMRLNPVPAHRGPRKHCLVHGAIQEERARKMIS